MVPKDRVAGGNDYKEVVLEKLGDDRTAPWLWTDNMVYLCVKNSDISMAKRKSILLYVNLNK